ncbi:MAG: Hpt domain-containing protein [Thermodesulfobacteriota bacterium]
MNISEQAERLGLETGQYRELVQLFVENTRRELSEIEQAIRENNFKKAADLVHSFKGAAANLGIDDIAAGGEKLGHAIRNRQSGIEQTINKLHNDVERLSQTI